MVEAALLAQFTCLAEAVFAEARGEDYAGQVYVAATIKNRVLDDRFADDFCEVIHEPWQFSYTHQFSRKKLQEMKKDEPGAWERARRVAYSVFKSGKDPLFENVLYYHATHIKPNWDYSKLNKGLTLGSHTFYSDAS